MKMKMILTMMILLAGTGLASDPAVFRVSQTHKTKEQSELFRRLWDSLQFVCPEVDGQKASLTITQALGEASPMQLYIAYYKGQRVAVSLEDAALLENASVEAWIIEDGVYDGRTALGAATRLPRYKEIKKTPRPGAPNKEDFLSHLKGGGEYLVKIRAQKACKPCFGNGKLSALKGNKPCETCDGDGSELQEWVLKW
jgi:hypothetical protein